MIALEASQLVKRYKDHIYALANLDLSVEAGGVFGLLGPNGAGKSTFLRIVVDLVRPTSGTIKLFGGQGGKAARRRIGAYIEGARFPPYLTATQILEWMATTAGHSRSCAPALLERVGLTSAAHRPVDGFSLGMKQRLGIATAMIGNPELIILDEPTNGLDPVGIAEIRALVRSIAHNDGATVLLSSHLLNEVQRVCDQVAIIDRGRLVVQGSISSLISGERKLRIRADPLAAVEQIVGDRGRREDDVVFVTITEADAPNLIAALCNAGISIFEAAWQSDDLESVFMKSTGG